MGSGPSEHINILVEAVTDYVNFTLVSNTACRDFYVNTKHQPWVTQELKELFNKKEPGNYGQTEVKADPKAN